MRPKTGLPSNLGPKGRPLLSTEPQIVPLKRDWISRSVLILALVLLAISVFGVWLRFRPISYETTRWLESGGLDRGRMLASLFEKTDFIGFPRIDVEHYLGPADFDERQFWYDLGPVDPEAAVEPRANVGDPTRLSAVFSYDRDGQVSQVLYSRRRPTLGSAPFDSVVWFGEDRTARRPMFIRTLGNLRSRSFDRESVEAYLGPPDGSRVRAQYDVGLAGAFIGTLKALIIDYDEADRVSRARITE